MRGPDGKTIGIDVVTVNEVESGFESAPVERRAKGSGRLTVPGTCVAPPSTPFGPDYLHDGQSPVRRFRRPMNPETRCQRQARAVRLRSSVEAAIHDQVRRRLFPNWPDSLAKNRRSRPHESGQSNVCATLSRKRGQKSWYLAEISGNSKCPVRVGIRNNLWGAPFSNSDS